METDRNKYAINLESVPSDRIYEYIQTQEEVGKAALTHLEIAWETLYYRGDSEHK